MTEICKHCNKNKSGHIGKYKYCDFLQTRYFNQPDNEALKQ